MKYEKILTLGAEKAADLEKLCQYPSDDIRKDEKVFDEEVVFEDGCRVAAMVCASLNPREEECWTQAVLFSSNGEELACTEVGESILGEFYLFYGEDEYCLEVKVYDGSFCPNCGDQITGNNIEPEGADLAYRNCSCTECSAIWTEELKVVHFDNLEVEENK